MAYSVTSGEAAQAHLRAVCQASQDAAGIPVRLQTGTKMLTALSHQSIWELVAIRYETPNVREDFREYVLGMASQGPGRTLSRLSASEVLINLPEAEFTHRLEKEARRIADEFRKWGLM